MTKNTMALISVVVVLGLAGLAVRSWLRRKNQQSASFSQPLEALEFFGQQLGEASGFYVATTYAQNLLERIAAYGLGVRGKAKVLVFTEGILIVRTGEVPLAIDKSAILRVGTNQAVIDRAVEPGGLISIEWLHEQTQLATHLRIVDEKQRRAILNSLKSITGEATK